VQAANSLIKKNQHQIPKDIYSLGGEGERLKLRQAYSDKEEASIVANEIRRLRKAEKAAYSDFAILYRTNAQSRSFEEEFRRQGIPYRIYGGMSFYQRKEIKDVIAYFRLIVNPHDEEAFRRIVNYPARGIGNTTLQKIWKDDSYFAARSMDVYITKLRKYLKADPTVEIVNVHGVGFKLTHKEQ
jgi:DNA helicase-2/ATP-dependent DNA helicase PcrA